MYTKNSSSYSDLARKEKRVRTCLENTYSDNCRNGLPISGGLGDFEYSYDINFLSMLIDKEMDHYTSLWSSSNCIGQREMRDWLWKLWRKPGIRDLIWKGACLALNAGKWYERVGAICTFHEIPSPLCDDKLPVGTGSNPVYLNGGYVIKIFAEDGLEACLYGLGTELEFHDLLNNQNSPLKNFIPSVLLSGILLFENGLYRVLPWDGRGIPEVLASSCLVSIKQKELDYPFGVWGKKQFEHQNAGKPLHELGDCGKSTLMWPYIVTTRCRGRIFSDLRDTLPLEVVLNLASFLGEQLHNLHLLPVPCPSLYESVGEEDYIQSLHFNVNAADKIDHSAEWKLFVSTLTRKRKDVLRRLSEGH